MTDQLEHVYQELAGNNLAVILGARRTPRSIAKAIAKFRPTLAAEIRLASLFKPPEVWQAFRQCGMEPNNLPRRELNRFHIDVREQALDWCARFVDEHPELGFDRDRVRVRLLLHQVDRTGVSSGTGGLRHELQLYTDKGEPRHLHDGAHKARAGVESAATWTATVDVAASMLGAADLQVAEHRRTLTADIAELERMLERARPLLVDHGADGDLYDPAE